MIKFMDVESVIEVLKKIYGPFLLVGGPFMIGTAIWSAIFSTATVPAKYYALTALYGVTSTVAGYYTCRSLGWLRSNKR
ncbi:MAG: hypothetical protein EOP06_24270 [Proteobacteria bacterium]|nr:MAG: hypothetical protein EOP06_24270 [Pseudomonadota bacterium]